MLRKKLAELAESDLFKGLTIKTGLYFNKDIQEIVSVADAHHSDLIVMGTRGISTISNWLLGSNTQRVIRLTQAPVLTINEFCTDFKLDRLVFASNFEEKEG